MDVNDTLKEGISVGLGLNIIGDILGFYHVIFLKLKNSLGTIVFQHCPTECKK